MLKLALLSDKILNLSNENSLKIISWQQVNAWSLQLRFQDFGHHAFKIDAFDTWAKKNKENQIKGILDLKNIIILYWFT